MRLYRSGEYSVPDMDNFEEDEDIFEDDALSIEILPYSFSICKVEDYSAVNLEDEFCFTGKTDGEKSLVCLTDKVPANTTERAVSIFALSTFDTDYVLVKGQDLKRTVNALRREGYSVTEKED